MISKSEIAEGADLKQEFGITVTNVSVSNLDSEQDDQISVIKPTQLPTKLKWKIDFMVMPFFITIYF